MTVGWEGFANIKECGIVIQEDLVWDAKCAAHNTPRRAGNSGVGPVRDKACYKIWGYGASLGMALWHRGKQW